MHKSSSDIFPDINVYYKYFIVDCHSIYFSIIHIVTDHAQYIFM